MLHEPCGARDGSARCFHNTRADEGEQVRDGAHGLLSGMIRSSLNSSEALISHGDLRRPKEIKPEGRLDRKVLVSN